MHGEDRQSLLAAAGERRRAMRHPERKARGVLKKQERLLWLYVAAALSTIGPVVVALLRSASAPYGVQSVTLSR
ncbi:hypothetical protein BO70DRAFT_360983 [Aspergillus heteromorphus CBS 117.55]|uniref:Uncharacterized protein n=1 Tax=Aspergillus heteromorphus CBS 117.55 TaxID=1448321 RepID=A0A317WI78_9EURO|nr:uncharacterized protein BO70DRAFT_360983 [Aspergillus heteromorphus CBS 117.55]PWY86166.1 hypothetical protein BO70DRAFT_360983 [Aspergillus heteromorphus CBS 117.55]